LRLSGQLLGSKGLYPRELLPIHNEVRKGTIQMALSAGIPAASIELDKNFTDDLEVDSLSMVEVVVACEERFGVKIPDEKVTDLATVGDAVNFIVNAAA
jgi:acyl carrier protein